MDIMEQLKVNHVNTMARLNNVDDELQAAIKNGDSSLIMSLMNKAISIHNDAMRKSMKALNNVG